MNFRKLISVGLSALTVAATFAACAPAKDQLDPAITLASSGVLANAQWLDERLETIPDEVVIGLGSNAAYGINMDNFENDGYIARAIHGEVLLFGKTEAGLDRAVREYAIAADAGATAELDTVYHEGVRVENMTIAGTDIAEFTIVYKADTPMKNPGSTGRTKGNAEYAATELSRLILKATGIQLPMKTHEEEVSGHVIVIDYITDGEHGENGFTYKVENGNLYINGVGEGNGCANGVYHFLENQCGWDALMYGNSNLQEAEYLDVPEGVSVDIDPIFDYVRYTTPWRHRAVNERDSFSQNYGGVTGNCGHGMSAHQWGGPIVNSLCYQYCYTDEGIYDFAFNSIVNYIEAGLASGKVIGEDFVMIDLGACDNAYYCHCINCLQVYREEYNTHVGAIVRWTNNMVEDIEANNPDHDGLVYGIFAYHGTNKPCKTTVRDEVHITLCTDGCCAVHAFSGEDCFGESFNWVELGGGMEHYSINNKDFAEWMYGWGEICKNVLVWHYMLDNNFGQYTMVDSLYGDFHLFKEAGIKGMYLESESAGIGLAHLRKCLITQIVWNPDMTEEEYLVRREEIMEQEYGAGWTFIQDFLDLWHNTEVTASCTNCWGYGNLFCINNYDSALYREYIPQLLEYLERAKKFCATADEEKRIERLELEVLYRECALNYFDAYNSGDMDMIEHLKGQYDLFVKYSLNNTYALDAYPGGLSNSSWKFHDNLEDAAWIDWKDYWEVLPGGDAWTEMPEKYVKYYEELEAAATATSAS